MDEREAAELVEHGPGFAPARRGRAGGGCPACFRGDYFEPPAMCGDCEDATYEAERAAAEFAFWDELEFDRDFAFDQLVAALDTKRSPT